MKASGVIHLGLFLLSVLVAVGMAFLWKPIGFILVVLTAALLLVVTACWGDQIADYILREWQRAALDRRLKRNRRR